MPAAAAHPDSCSEIDPQGARPERTAILILVHPERELSAFGARLDRRQRRGNVHVLWSVATTALETADGRFDEDRLREYVTNYDGPEDPDYPGCVPIPMTREQFDNYEGGVEYWTESAVPR